MAADGCLCRVGGFGRPAGLDAPRLCAAERAGAVRVAALSVTAGLPGVRW
jgi:hypothetical protein